MTQEEQRIAIAEACGWFRLSDNPSGPLERAYINFDKTVPRYTEDLNAMHNAVRSIAVTRGTEWAMRLREIVVRDHKHDPLCTIDTGLVNDCWFYNATAAQRAEAFLRTIGKWRDE